MWVPSDHSEGWPLSVIRAVTLARFAAVAMGGGMVCDICGRDMRITSESTEGQKKWVCPWCYAMTDVEIGGTGIGRPPYQPIYGRWDRVDADRIAGGTAHAYGYFGTTLCGLKGVKASPYLWVPGWPNACSSCKDSANTIDQRWPLDKRGWREQVHSDSNPSWPPF